MKDFEQAVSNGAVLVAVDERYNDNDGAYDIAIVWTGTKVVHFRNNGYVQEFHTHGVPRANEEQKQAAIDYEIANTEESNNWNKYCYGGRGADTYIGCIVTLQRSRKAPNKTPLEVVDFEQEYYNEYYNNRSPERIAVLVDGSKVWVSTGCIKEVVKGVKKLPFWCK